LIPSSIKILFSAISSPFFNISISFFYRLKHTYNNTDGVVINPVHQ
jgi:hypothetical protein